MRILSRYFVVRYLGLFVSILAASIVTVTIVEALIGQTLWTDSETGLEDVVNYVLLRVPSYYLRDLIPISAFVAAFLTGGLAVRWLEWTACQAGGISPLRIVFPILVTACVLAGFNGWLSETILTRASRSFSALNAHESDDLIFERGGWWYHNGRYLYSIQSGDKESRTLRGVEIFERSPKGRLLKKIQTRRLRVDPDGIWQISDAEVRTFMPEQPEQATQIQHHARISLAVDADSDALLQRTDPSMLSASELSQTIEKSKDQQSGHLLRLRVRLHQRLSDPLLLVLFTIMALPIGLSARGGSSLTRTSLLAVGALVLFLFIRSLSRNLALEGLLEPAWTAWSPLLAFASISFFVLHRVGRPG